MRDIGKLILEGRFFALRTLTLGVKIAELLCTVLEKVYHAKTFFKLPDLLQNLRTSNFVCFYIFYYIHKIMNIEL